jgi:hypothetical protein
MSSLELHALRSEVAASEAFDGCVNAAMQLESLDQHRAVLYEMSTTEVRLPSLEGQDTRIEDLFPSMIGSLHPEFSQEMIREGLEKIWQAIKNGIWRLIRATRDFFSRLIQGTDGLLKSAGKLRQRLEKAKSQGLAPPTRGITITGGSRLHMGGRIEADELTAGIQNGVDVLSQAKALYLEGASGLVTELETLTGKLSDVDARSADTLDRDVRALSTYPSKISVDLDKLIKSMRSDELPGGKRVQVQLTEYTKRGVPKTMPDLELVDYQRGSGYRERDTVEVPAVPQLDTLLTHVEELLGTVAESNDRSDALTQRYERLVDRAESLFDRQSVMGRLKDHLHEQTVELLMKFYQMAMPTAIHRLAKYEYAVARATLVYVRACVDSYQTPT